MSEDPAELQRFYDETVEPLVAYDEQYETRPRADARDVPRLRRQRRRTAARLFTHRHTIRYRLERVRELSGLDVGSTDGREKLSLGLKAMRVLGIARPPGASARPAARAAGCAGRVPRPTDLAVTRQIRQSRTPRRDRATPPPLGAPWRRQGRSGQRR